MTPAQRLDAVKNEFEVVVLSIKTRRYHNNKGFRQICNGKPRQQMIRLARKLSIPYGKRNVIAIVQATLLEVEKSLPWKDGTD